METIITYLENMFAGLPQNEKTKKAKRELLAIMEDKYNELKAQGKTENEAIGTVIAEFGNLSELAEELGLNKIDITASARREVSLEEVQEYISACVRNARQIGLGVMLCILSPILLILLAGISDSGIAGISGKAAAFGGLVGLLALVAAAVTIFITSGMNMSRFNYLKNEEFNIAPSALTYLKQSAAKFQNTFALSIATGVGLCILSVIPLIGIAILIEDGFPIIIGVAILLLLVGIGVFLLVNAGTTKGGYSVLLQEGEYADKKAYREINRIGEIYWAIVTVVYLAWSFISWRWQITWIIWPIAGIIFGVVSYVYSATRKRDTEMSK